MKRAALVGIGLALAGCSDELDNGRVYLVTGLEDDTWTAKPTPESVTVERVLADGTEEPVTTLDVPEGDESPNFELTGPVSRLVVSGSTRDGDEVVRGRSFWFEPDGLKELSVPLFVGRVGAFSRPGSLLHDPGENPVLAVIGGRFLLAGGADDGGKTQMSGFDFGFWSPTTTEYYQCGDANCEAKSIAVIAGSVALVIGEDWSYARDFTTNYGHQYAPPNGLESWNQVAGGQAIQVEDGSAYVVGATRIATRSQTVVRLASDFTVEIADLEAERAGAAATWVTGRGLLVVGGSDTAPGVELLAEGALQAVALPFPPDATTGSALVAFDENQVLRLGGRLPSGNYAPSVVIKLNCAQDNCNPLPFEAPVELDRAQAFHLGDQVLVVGDDSEGMTAARLVTEDGVETVELREPRSGARAVRNTLDQVLVVGGTDEDGHPASSIELFTR